LNSQIANLQQVIKSRQTVAAEQGTNHSKLVVVGLQAKLVSLGNNFKSVQEIRTEVNLFLVYNIFHFIVLF
jgi:nitrate reductase NapAB chaperone NapD